MNSFPSTSKLLQTFRISPKPRFSQNFLKDSAGLKIFQNSIFDYNENNVAIHTNNVIVEIGCGPGSITRSLLKKSFIGTNSVEKVVGIEIDSAFEPILQSLKDAANTTIHEPSFGGNSTSCAGINIFDFVIADGLDKSVIDYVTQQHVIPALEIANNNGLVDNIVKPNVAFMKSRSANPVYGPMSTSKLHIVGNLPFNCVSRFLLQWTEDAVNRTGFFSTRYPVEFTIMIQEEMAQKLCFQCENKQDYNDIPGNDDSVKNSKSVTKSSRLGRILQAVFTVKIMHTFPKSSFWPEPKVKVSIVKLVPIKNEAKNCVISPLLNNAQELDDFKEFLNLVCQKPNQVARKAFSKLNDVNVKGDPLNSEELLDFHGINAMDRIFSIPTPKLVSISKYLGLKSKRPCTAKERRKIKFQDDN